MGLHENNKLNIVLDNNKQDNQNLKEKFFNDKYKKVSISVDKMDANYKFNYKKKPFLKLGLILIIISVICLLIINLSPWAYVLYDNKTVDIKNNEFFYYKDKIDNSSNDSNFSSFFKSEDSFRFLGVNSFTFNSFYKTQSLILYTIIILGLIFTILGFFLKRSDLSIEKYKLFHCFFAILTGILSIIIIIDSVKFLGAEMLLFYNGSFISDNIQNLALIFISPILLIFLASVLLKTIITILKININFFEKLFDEKLTYNYKKFEVK